MWQRWKEPAAVLLLFALFLAASALPGCGLIGEQPNVDSTADAILEAKASAKAYALLVGDLLEGGVITPDQAAEQLEHLRTVQRELERATDVLELTGDPFAAGDALERTERALDLVLQFLAEYEVRDGNAR